jgi:hypothetical protein
MNESFKMSVVQKNRYFSTRTNLYALSDTLGKNSPKFCFQWCKSSLQFARRAPRNCDLDSFTTIETPCIFDHQINSLSNLRIGFKVILTSSNDMNDNNAWQKAQLFRQSIEQISDNDHSHCLRINLKIVKKWSISHTLDLIFATLLF